MSRRDPTHHDAPPPGPSDGMARAALVLAIACTVVLLAKIAGLW